MLSPDSPLTPYLLGIVLAGLLALLVLRAVRKDRREYGAFKRLRSTDRRQAMFRKWILESFLTFGGASLVVLLLAWPYVGRLLTEVNAWPFVVTARTAFTNGGGLAIGITIGLSLALLGGTVLAIVAARNEETVPTVGDIHALLPRNRRELWSGAALSINAGVVEELLFRLALPALLFGVTGSAIAAIAASVLLFGALHIYQGVWGVVGSTVLGAFFMALYLASGTILLPILVHALVDLRSLVLIPVIVYRVHKKTA